MAEEGKAFHPPPPLDMEFGKLEQSWQSWLQRFDIFLLASQSNTLPEKVQVARFLNAIGEQALRVYNTFVFDPPEAKDELQAVKDKFTAYCTPIKTVVFERYRFWSIKQAPGESIDSFVTSLRGMSETCEFGDQEESLIRDRVVLGCSDPRVQERLLREADLTLHKALHICRAAEGTKEQLSNPGEDDKTLKNIAHKEQEEQTLKVDLNSARPVTVMTPTRLLEEYEYRFNDNGELRNINTGDRFKYDFHPSKADNERRYKEIAKIVQEYVGEQLEMDAKCEMHKIYLPVESTMGEPVTFVYASPDIHTNPNKLLIIVGGSDPVRAGIWSRRAVINDSIEAGSQIPYIRQARSEGYAVLILNQNQTYVEKDGLKVPVRENKNCLEHVLHVWDKVIIGNTRAKHIAFVAHTFGGNVIAQLAEQRRDSFEKLVFALALCHCHRENSFDKAPKEVANFLKSRSRFWMASQKPLNESLKKSGKLPFMKKKTDLLSAGDTRPEWTAHSSKDSIFQFLRDMEK